VATTDALSPAQKRELLQRLLAERSRSRPDDRGVHRQFEAQASRTPEAVAVASAGATLTYRALNERATALAHRLRALGVGPEVLVGLCLERTPDLLVGLLGILKAGGAYVPLDPHYPQERLAFMLGDSRAPVLVTQQSLLGRPPGHEAEVVLLSADDPAPGGVSAADPPGGAGPENLAYVIYTSGSTGRPKGVQVTHGALSNFLAAMRSLLGMTERDSLLAVTTLSFDIAALELYLPLTVGARVELAARDEAADGARLAARLERSAVNFLQATPASWRMLLDGGWRGDPSLTMLCGGEALPRDVADRLLPLGRALWNLYGPTETTVWSSAAKVEPGEGPVTIGRPILNTQTYVLDARLRPVPIGLTGELYIGGAGLARGYLGRPGLTGERFVPDPYGPAPGARLYRTGDLARWRPDGTLECLGRVDHQVKIRGFRVEPGEVEAALVRHPAVSQAAVVARRDASGEDALVAFVVPAPGSGADAGAAALRPWLAERLPEYMVPSAFVRLDALPLTPNGKVDRNALPDVSNDQGGGASGALSVPPRGPIEEDVARTWGELLGRDWVGVHDNFFDLGGHSLLATQVLTRLRDAFGVDVSLREFLDGPTVAGLARHVEQALAIGPGRSSPPIERVGRDGPLPASFAQQRLWYLDQLDPGSPAYNIPTAVRVVGALDVDALARALNEVVRRHEVLRTTLTAEGGVPHQTIAPSLSLPLPLVDRSASPEPDREAGLWRLLHDEALKPFDLARGPLIRFGLIRLSEREHVVQVAMHHVASDGWSMGVLVREVGALYEAFRKGESSPLPDLPVQYADFAAWQHAWLTGEVLREQTDYWRAQLAGLPALDLPTDRPATAAGSARAGLRSLKLPDDLLDGVKALGRREGATLSMTFLAAFQALLHRYTGQADFAVGTPVAGRTRSEVEGLIGFFVNTLVLRADVSGDPSFRELLRRTRRTALGAYAHQDLPYEKLAGELANARGPLFRVMFVTQNAPMPAVSAPGLEMTPLDWVSEVAKFDLILYIEPAAGGFRAVMEFNRDLYDEATVGRMLGHYQTLLEGAVAEPDRSVGALPMLSDEEQRQLLGQSGAEALSPEDLDALSDDELDDLLNRFESAHDV
jgi:amino acid adenylation domain-containing protein